VRLLIAVRNLRMGVIMGNRLIGAARQEGAGYVSIAVGALWETIEAAHNWSYICEIARKSGIFSAARELAHPSPLAMIMLGALWALLARLLRRKVTSSPQIIPFIDPNGTIRAVLRSTDEVFLNVHNSDGSGLTIVKKASKG
jgi:hypothetical protein